MKAGGIALLCCSVLLLSSEAGAQQTLSPVAERDYVGNVVGTVIDATTGRRIRDVTVLLLERPWQFGSLAGLGGGRFLEDLLASSVRFGHTDASGRFLINQVPTPYPF